VRWSTDHLRFNKWGSFTALWVPSALIYHEWQRARNILWNLPILSPALGCTHYTCISNGSEAEVKDFLPSTCGRSALLTACHWTNQLEFYLKIEAKAGESQWAVWRLNWCWDGEGDVRGGVEPQQPICLGEVESCTEWLSAIIPWVWWS